MKWSVKDLRKIRAGSIPLKMGRVREYLEHNLKNNKTVHGVCPRSLRAILQLYPARPTIPDQTLQHTDEASTSAELKVSVEASTQLGDEEGDVDEALALTFSTEPNASVEASALLGDEEGDVESPTLILTAKLSLLKLNCDDSKSLSNVKDLESLRTNKTSFMSTKSMTNKTFKSKIPVRITTKNQENKD